MFLQLSYFSAVDEFLLDWLPLIVGFVLTIWLSAEINDTPTANEKLSEPPKPLPAKKMGKPSTKMASVAALIASEYQKRS